MKRILSFIKALFLVSILFVGLSTLASNCDNGPVESACIGAALTAVAIILQYTTKSKKRNGFVSNDFTEGLCVTIQTALNNVFTANDPAQKRTNVGYLQAIRSPQNRSGFNQTPLTSEDGKVHAVKVTGITRGCEDDVTDVCPDPDNDTCVGDKIVAPWEDTVTEFLCITSPAFMFKESDMRKLCENDDAYRAKVINAHIDPMMVKLNKLMITIQNSNFGNFFDGTSAAHDINLLNANGTPNYVGEAEIMEAFEDLEINSRPILVGSGKLGRYIRQVGIGCCNDGGINLAQAGNLDFFRDKYVEDIIGADEFIGLQPGLVQLVTKNQNKGQYVRNHEHYINNTFVDPFTGIEIDMDMIYDECKRQYYMKFYFQWMLYFLTDKARQSCDELYGVNGSLNFKALQA